MGSGQSVPAPRTSRKGQNKLSKPRTNSTGNVLNTTIPNIYSRRNSQSNASPRRSRYSLFSADGQGEHGDDEKEPRRRSRRSIFRSRSSQTRSRVMLDIDAGVSTDFTDPAPVEPPVRRYSIVNHNSKIQSTPDLLARRPSFNARASLQHVPTSTAHAQSRLPMVQEIRSLPLEEVDIVRSSVYNQGADAQLLNPMLSSRTNSDTTLYGPTRRKSLQQHGVVTRKGGFAANDPRKSLPSQVNHVEQLQDYYNDPSRSTSFAFTTLVIPPSSPGQRVQTPNDLDYGHIGAYKLGSLRITNGTASPTPSSKDGRLTTSKDDDYLSMGIGHRDANQRHGLSQRSNTLIPGESIKPPWIIRAESPLRRSHKIEHETLTIETQLPNLDPSLALFDFQTINSPSSSLQLANKYMQDLPSSPFSFDESHPSPSTAFQVTSKNTALEDDLFDPEPGTPPLDEALSAPKSYDSGYGSTDSPVVVEGPREYPPKPLAKADSGYSSNISLRSFKKDAAPIVPAKDDQVSIIREAASRVSSSTYSISSTASEKTVRADQPLPKLPAQDIISRPQFRQAPPAPPSGKIPIIRDPIYQKSPPTVPPRAAEQERTSDLKVHKRQQSLPSVPAKIPQELKNSLSGNLLSSSDSKSNSKAQKQPVSMQSAYTAPVYTIQAFQSPNDAYGIPAVPAETERKLTERVGGFPVVSFPNTFSDHAGLRKSSSKETLGTIFSVGSAEVRDEIEFARLQGKLPPIPSTIPENPSVVPRRKPTPNRRATFQASSINSMSFWKMSFRSKSRKPEPASKTAERQDEEFEAHVTSFETIASSLGRSPYDAAAIGGRPASSGEYMRAKSMTSQFEAEAAQHPQRNRSIPRESQASTMLLSRRSYDSIAGRNSLASGTSTVNRPRKSSRGLAPSAHANKTAWKANSRMSIPPQVFIPSTASNSHFIEAGSSSPGSGDFRHRNPPPVSMKTQRKSLPSILGSPTTPSKSISPPLPNRVPLQTPSAQGPETEPPTQEVQDQWFSQKSFWAARRKSASEALQTRKSLDLQQPGSSRPSIESQQDSRMNYGMEIQRASTTAPDHHRTSHRQPDWDYDYRVQQQNPRPWTGNSTGRHSNFSPQWVQRQTSAEYNHTYQSSTVAYSQEAEYYPPTTDDGYYAQPDINVTSQNIHSRKNSTDDMLVLDRFSGGLGYNYDPSYGIVGSAGSGISHGTNARRKSVEVSKLYGVDFSDVPVILQRVRISS